MEKKRNIIFRFFGGIKKHSTLLIILFIFLFLFACDHLGSKTGSAIIDDLRSIATTFTPTTDLFDDGSEVSFVSYFFGMNSTKNDTKIAFYHPTAYANTSTQDDYLLYDFTGTISSISTGRVRAVGYLPSGEKYIELEHQSGYVSRYVGVSTIGVSSGQSVSAQTPLGLCAMGNPCRVYLYQNGTLVKMSSVIWQD